MSMVGWTGRMASTEKCGRMAPPISWLLLAAAVTLLLVIPGSLAANSHQLKRGWKMAANLWSAKICPEPQIVYFAPLTLRRSKEGDVYFNSSGVITEDVERFSELSVNLTRCREAISSNTCEYYNTFRWTVGVCSIMLNPMVQKIWGNWIPKLKCPMKKGKLIIADSKLHLDESSAIIDWPGYVWVGRAILRAEHKVFNCVEFEFEVKKTRA